MWLSKADYERLLTDAAQSTFLANALVEAQERAEEAEKRLAEERSAKDWLTLQLSSRLVTKNGGYGLDHEIPTPKAEAKPPHPLGYVRDPDDTDMMKLDYYKKCYREAGRDEQDAMRFWESEMRGESPPIEYEAEQ